MVPSARAEAGRSDHDSASGTGTLDVDATSTLFGGGVSYADGKLYATNGLGDAAALDAIAKALPPPP